MPDKKETPLVALCKKSFPGLRFKKHDSRQAGRILKSKGEGAAVAFLEGKGGTTQPNFKPPVKCNIVAMSRPLEEWPIYKASVVIQKYVYAQSYEEFKATDPGKSEAGLRAWLKATRVDTDGYFNVQGLNLIFQNARATYEGVLKKVENRNSKKVAKIEQRNEHRAERGLPLLTLDEPETALDETGHLRHRPGINCSVFGYQHMKLKPYVPGSIPGVTGYSRDPSTPIAACGVDRLEIPEGQPGYVPPWDRENLSVKKHRRKRASWARSRGGAIDDNMLLAVVRVADDWALLDLRGLLRNTQYRKLLDRSVPVTIESLLNLVTNDPTLSVVKKPGKPVRYTATLIYKQGVVPVVKAKVVKGSYVSKMLDDTTETFSLVGVDLGVNNLIAANALRIRPGKCVERLQAFTLPEQTVEDFFRFRKAYDKHQENLRLAAVRSLTAEQQAEVLALDTFGPEQAKMQVCGHLGLSVDEVPWDKVNSRSSILSDLAKERGVDDTLYMFPFFKGKGKKRKTEIRKRWDVNWAQHFRPQLTSETRKALNEAKWEAERNSSKYHQLSIRKKELSRHCVNYVIRTAEKRAQCGKVIVAVEDLHHSFRRGGKGSRKSGWGGFFAAKQEGRWLMDALFGAFCDLAVHRGYRVIKVDPYNTSRTCPECGHCDKANRDRVNREAFICVCCGYRGNADIDVAAYNIAMVAITGVSLRKAARASVASTPLESLAAE